MQRRKVSVAVEGIEVGVQSRVLPDALAWIGRATFCRRRLDSHHVEAVSQRFKRFVGKQGLHGCAAIVYEGGHLAFGIAFRHVGNVYAACGVGSRLQCCVGCYVLLAYMPYQYVGGHYGVRKRCRCLPAVVEQFHRNVYGIFRERHQEDVLERLRGGLGFVVGKPFLEKCGERVAEENSLRAMVAHRNLSVAFHGQLA